MYLTNFIAPNDNKFCPSAFVDKLKVDVKYTKIY